MKCLFVFIAIPVLKFHFIGVKTYLAGRTPVSYTHLDVYKRQPCHMPLILAFETSGDCLVLLNSTCPKPRIYSSR